MEMIALGMAVNRWRNFLNTKEGDTGTVLYIGYRGVLNGFNDFKVGYFLLSVLGSVIV